MAEKNIELDSVEIAAAVFGNCDRNIRLLENEFSVTAVCRGTQLRLSGEPANVAAASRAVDPVIDAADPIAESYFLEVGSPGLGRRLTRPEHFAQYQGQKVAARLIRPDEAGRREYAGPLAAFEGGRVTIAAPEGEKTFELASASYVKLCDDEDLF